MGKALLAVIVTIMIGYWGMVVGFELMGGFPEFGPLAAIAAMGGFIIYFNESKK